MNARMDVWVEVSTQTNGRALARLNRQWYYSCDKNATEVTMPIALCKEFSSQEFNTDLRTHLHEKIHLKNE